MTIFVLNIYCVLYWCVVYVQYYKSLTKCSRLNSTKKQKLFNTGQKKNQSHLWTSSCCLDHCEVRWEIKYGAKVIWVIVIGSWWVKPQMKCAKKKISVNFLPTETVRYMKKGTSTLRQLKMQQRLYHRHLDGATEKIIIKHGSPNTCPFLFYDQSAGLNMVQQQVSQF